MCKKLTKEDYLSALPESIRDKLRKILQGRKGVKLPCVWSGCE